LESRIRNIMVPGSGSLTLCRDGEPCEVACEVELNFLGGEVMEIAAGAQNSQCLRAYQDDGVPSSGTSSMKFHNSFDVFRDRVLGVQHHASTSILPSSPRRHPGSPQPHGGPLSSALLRCNRQRVFSADRDWRQGRSSASCAWPSVLYSYM
jgi:hypothetical protein